MRASEGPLEFDLTWPKELGGAGGGGTNPEQLFAAGYAACFAQALVRAARDCNVPLNSQPAVTADVGIGRMENGRFGLDVELRVALLGVEREDADKLADMAHAEICPYSRATRGNLDVRVKVES